MTPSRAALADAVRRGLGYRFPRVGARAARLALRTLPRTVDTELFPGLRVRLDLDQPLQAGAFWTGERFERTAAGVLRRWLPGAERFFDVGANFGWFSYLALHVDPHVEVHSFEPQPDLHAVQLDVVRRNPSARRLHPEPIGLSDAPAELELLRPGADLGHATFAPHPAHRAADGTVPCRVERFDAWREAEGIALPAAPAWVLKMDIEGFEPRALAGMEATLRARAFRGLVVELNEYTLALAGSTTAEVRAQLADCGYVEDRSVADPGLNGFFVPAAT